MKLDAGTPLIEVVVLRSEVLALGGMEIDGTWPLRWRLGQPVPMGADHEV